MISVWFIIND